MARIVMTRELAQRASWDAANRTMRAAGRKAWSEDDAIVAAREFNRLWPTCRHGCEPGECYLCDRSATANDSEPDEVLISNFAEK